MQRGGGNSVARCRVQDCRGNGLHPGGGLQDSTFSENVVRKNRGEGLYFCAGVRHVVVSNNVFAGNEGNGIGALGDNGDKYNVVANNVCEANGGSGIWLFDGDNNTVVNNICINNSQSAPGQACGIVLNQTADTIVSGNRCLDDQATKTQKHGILEFSSCRSNVIANNLCRGNAGSGLALAGKDTRQSGNLD
jgi:parallel beta-helix repeat protein